MLGGVFVLYKGEEKNSREKFRSWVSVGIESWPLAMCFNLYFISEKLQLLLEDSFSVLNFGTTLILPEDKSMSARHPTAET